MKKSIAISAALLAIICGCHHTQPVAAQPSSGGSELLYQFKWNLTALNGQPIAAEGRDTAYLLFYPGQVNRVSGSAGCNRLNGTVELTGDHTIRFSPLATTRKACPGQTEPQFLTALSVADNWSVANNRLSLNNGNREVAKLQGVSAAQLK